MLYQAKAMNITIITGARGAGKTSFLKEQIRTPEFSGKKITGFYAENRGDGYEIVNLQQHEKVLLCKRNDPGTGKLRLQDFYFSEAAIKTGKKWIEKNLRLANAVFVIDEAGRFELDGYVWDSLIRKVLKNNAGSLIMVVRKKFLEDVIKKYGLDNSGNDLKIIEV